ncbi:MAG: GvpL/GvpF-family gas vesicle protein 1 [Rhodospirillaceae bacterium]|nr:MAG: GvpL/GvpF-family gas vesicle protein 1 [Rhodospirillaceae bacterium]
MTEQDQPSACKYLYAIIPTPGPETFTSPGINGPQNAVHTLTFGRLAAVVSDSPQIEYDNTRRNMMAHTRVLEEVMQTSVLLPVRFGTVASTPEIITDRLLTPRYDEFSHLLEQVRDRVELGLKAFWQEGIVFKEIIDENPDIRKRRDALQKRPLDRSHAERRTPAPWPGHRTDSDPQASCG